MKASRFNEEQIIGILQEQEAGSSTADVCRKHGISVSMRRMPQSRWSVRLSAKVRRAFQPSVP